MKAIGTVIFTLAIWAAQSDKTNSAPAEKLTVAPIQQVIEKYNQSSGVKTKLVKTVKLELLDETRTSKGEMYFQKGRIRLDVFKPDNSMMIVGGGTIWIEDEVEGFKGKKKHVTKIYSKQLNRQMRAPLAALFGRKKAWEEFKVIGGDRKNNQVTLKLSPKQKKNMEITEMTVVMNTEKQIILSVSYADDLDNLVTYEFSDHKVDVKIPEDKFNYEPPADAEVVSF